MNQPTIINSDAVKWANAHADAGGAPFHAMLCDPPYHLTSITKRFGKKDSAPAKPGTDGAFGRMSRGFMGKEWDGGDLAFNPETWIAFKRVLLPGAFCFIFAGTRGYHRMAAAIEEAGYIIHPAIGWVFGGGFPKATRIDTQIDKAAGAAQERGREWTGGGRSGGIMGEAQGTVTRQIGKAKTEQARVWENHRYGLQALAPAFEFICVAQVPYQGRPIDCITKSGAGALNIGQGRIPTGESLSYGSRVSSGNVYGFYNGEGGKAGAQDEAGRWPKNFIVGDEFAASMIDRQSGYSSSRSSGRDMRLSVTGNPTDITTNVKSGIHHGDSGGASRFFFNVRSQIDEADQVIYASKAGTTEKESGLEHFKQKTSDEMDVSIHAKPGRARTPQSAIGGARKRVEKGLPAVKARANPHPTVKPLHLTKHLAALLLPPAAYNARLFVPFGGVASEATGAMLAGWHTVYAVEMEQEYCEIAAARTKFWSCNVGLFDELINDEPDEPEQLTMFDEED